MIFMTRFMLYASTFKLISAPTPASFRVRMGATHFLTRKLNGVSAEMSLNVLAYNLKRVMKILGISSLMKALSA